MELAEANRRICMLEQRYFELHRVAMEAKAELLLLAALELGADPSGDVKEARLRLEKAEGEKRAALAEIERIEDRLLEDD